MGICEQARLAGKGTLYNQVFLFHRMGALGRTGMKPQTPLPLLCPYFTLIPGRKQYGRCRDLTRMRRAWNKFGY